MKITDPNKAIEALRPLLQVDAGKADRESILNILSGCAAEARDPAVHYARESLGRTHRVFVRASHEHEGVSFLLTSSKRDQDVTGVCELNYRTHFMSVYDHPDEASPEELEDMVESSLTELANLLDDEDRMNAMTEDEVFAHWLDTSEADEYFAYYKDNDFAYHEVKRDFQNHFAGGGINHVALYHEGTPHSWYFNIHYSSLYGWGESDLLVTRISGEHELDVLLES